MKNFLINEGTDLNTIIKKSQGEIMFDDNLLIFNPVIYDNLPQIFKPILGLIQDPQKKDIALLSILTIFSGILRNYETKYDGKQEGCQLYSYVLGNAGNGKGFAAQFREVGVKLHKYLRDKEKRKFKDSKSANEPRIKPITKDINWNKLFLTSNITKASLSSDLNSNGGYGLFYLTETDTLSSANRSDFGQFSDILRIGFHGEAYSVGRNYLEEPIEIDKVFLSVFMTSTLNQCFKLLPSYEDGLFSRFIYYHIKGNHLFEDVFAESNNGKLLDSIEELGNTFLDIALVDSKKDKISFALSSKQREVFMQFFSHLKTDFIESIDRMLEANIHRLALSTVRIAMLLTYARIYSTQNFENQVLVCSDEDFDTALSIADTLKNHLKLLDFNYKSQNKNVINSVNIQFEATTKSNKRNALKNECKRLFDTGLSFRKIAEVVLGNPNKSGTIHKWLNPKRASFPFPETETPNMENPISTKALLKNAEVSFFENAKSDVGEQFTLYQLINKDYTFKEQVEEIRMCHDKTKRDGLKKQAFAFTASGTFDGKRKKEKLLKHSGFICIDIDKKDNERIGNFNTLHEEFSKIINIAVCSKSIGGEGYFLLIPIKDTSKHEAYFDALHFAFEELGISIDKSCRDITRLRFVSEDPSKYIAHEVVLFDSILPIQPTKIEVSDNSIHDILSLILSIQDQEIDITCEYCDWFAIGCALANTYGEEGFNYYIQLSQFHPKYNYKEAHKQYKSCLLNAPYKNGYGIGTIYLIAKKYGMKL